MKTFRIRTLAIVFIVALCMSGCASTKGYFADRVQDAGDIFTATVGVGTGAAAKVSLFNIGVLSNEDKAGLRGGTLFHDPEEAKQFDLLLFGQTKFWTSRNAIGRNKCVDEFRVLGVNDIPRYSCTGKANVFQIEAVAGLGPSVRLGFNPAEAVDFALGWLGIDIFADDMNHKALIIGQNR